jgi:hypothetical protein
MRPPSSGAARMPVSATKGIRAPTDSASGKSLRLKAPIREERSRRSDQASRCGSGERRSVHRRGRAAHGEGRRGVRGNILAAPCARPDTGDASPGLRRPRPPHVADTGRLAVESDAPRKGITCRPGFGSSSSSSLSWPYSATLAGDDWVDNCARRRLVSLVDLLDAQRAPTGCGHVQASGTSPEVA